jgi:hypothetical protein
MLGYCTFGGHGTPIILYISSAITLFPIAQKRTSEQTRKFFDFVIINVLITANP